eukprot:CAMPEP_0170470396 /NCGR_PEP_ID=MMETSP0123-20130129/12868_1 /TAXON_ID=182087 /ORGANISM="Favella ehrenbergii, Strain Fehren 1" /LENGTH=62 /DNA_ID=CAMNT_0010737507 /DNA_START=1239 /DNA_END=1427 /DNA_ORIENTATION=+
MAAAAKEEQLTDIRLSTTGIPYLPSRLAQEEAYGQEGYEDDDDLARGGSGVDQDAQPPPSGS